MLELTSHAKMLTVRMNILKRKRRKRSLIPVSSTIAWYRNRHTHAVVPDEWDRDDYHKVDRALRKACRCGLCKHRRENGL